MQIINFQRDTCHDYVMSMKGEKHSAFWEIVSWAMKWNWHFDEVCSCLANGYRLPKGLVCSANVVNIWCCVHFMHIIIMSSWLNCASHFSFRSTMQSRAESLWCGWAWFCNRLHTPVVTFSPTRRRCRWWSQNTTYSRWRGILTNT